MLLAFVMAVTLSDCFAVQAIRGNRHWQDLGDGT